MALIKANNHWVKGRPWMGTKAMRAPVPAAMITKGHLIKSGRGRRKMIRPTPAPPASWRNCLRVMSPTRRNS